MAMKWVSAAADNPGYSVWHSTPERDPNVQYIIRQKRKTRDFTPVGWIVYVRSSKTEPLRTIYGPAATLKEAKEFVEDWEKIHGQQED
ncbi:hypothetical protein [Mycobacterium sp. AZCC_0083]|uniref:hypothetical protein n=1 Tax=Mycobacterium sp. AZCC_0083 TaxID=2735882 RepID=UPI0016107C37|nr:hypothetical protein [Mycobacterium sp. AZCC_0083]MBB5167222.1 phosphomannomutase [Mycobacterium sp. AZCC_0083]